MSDVSGLIRNYITKPLTEKINAVVDNLTDTGPAPAASPVRAGLGQPAPRSILPLVPTNDRAYQIAAARANPELAGSLQGIEADMATMSMDELEQKYGANARYLIAQIASGGAQYGADASATRNIERAPGDILTGAGGAFLGTFGNIAALGAGLVNDRAGVEISRFTGDVVSGIRDFGISSPAQQRLRATEARTSLAADANKSRQREQNAQSAGRGSQLVNALERLGRDALDTVVQTAADPTAASDGIAQAIGSIGAAGKIVKGVSKVGGMVRLPAAAEVPVAIALQESAGTYSGTAEEAMAQLADRTDPTEEQKYDMANDAALRAAAITAGPAALAGRLVENVVRNPFRGGSLPAVGGNAAREAGEEFIQSGVGQYAQNQGIRSFVNEDQDLVDGVGGQAGVGALYGAGSVAGMQGPSGLARSIWNQTGRRVMERGEAINAAAEEPAATSWQEDLTANPEAVNDALSAIAEVSQTVAEAPNREASPEDGLDDNEKAQFQEYLGRFNSLVQMNPEETTAKYPTLTAGLEDPSSVFRLGAIAENTLKGDGTEAEKTEAARFLIDLRNRVGETLSGEMGEKVNTALTNTESGKSVTALIGALTKLSQDETIMAGINEVIAAQTVPSVDELKMAEPAVVEDAAAKVSLIAETALNTADNGSVEVVAAEASENATVAEPDAAADVGPVLVQEEKPKRKRSPKKKKSETSAEVATPAMAALDKVDPAVNRELLAKHAQGELDLTPPQVIDLAVSADLAEELQKSDAQTAAKANKVSENLKAVSDDIRTRRATGRRDNASLADHVATITKFVKAGDMQKAGLQLRALRNFAVSLRNKRNALAESRANTSPEGKVPAAEYQAWNPKLGVWYTDKTYARNMDFVAAVEADARAATAMYNKLSNRFTELTSSPAERNIPEKKIEAEAPPVEAAAEAPAPAAAASTKAEPKQENKKETKANEAPVAAASREQAEPEPEAPRAPEPTRAEPAARADDSTNDAGTVDASSAAVAEPAERSEGERDPVATDGGTDIRPVAENNQPEIVDALDQVIDTETQPNILKRAMRRIKADAKTTVSLLTGRGAQTISTIRNALSSSERMEALLESTGSTQKGRGWQLTEDVAAAYQQLLGKENAGAVGKAMLASLKEALNKPQKNEPTLLEQLRSGKNILSYLRLRAFNILERRDGDFTYNDELLQLAVAAGMQWLITGRSRLRPITGDALWDYIEKLDGDPTIELVEGLTAMTIMTGEIQGLAELITKFWGMRSRNDAFIGEAEGVASGVALELIKAMESAKMLERKVVKETTTSDREITFLSFLPSYVYEVDIAAVHEEWVETLMRFPDAIEAVVMSQNEDVQEQIGEPVKAVPMTQARNRGTETTTEQQDAVRAANNVPFFVNEAMSDLVDALGGSGTGLVRLLANGDLRKRKLNVWHEKSLASQNRLIASAARIFVARRAAMQAWAAEQKKPLREAAVYFGHTIIKNNRMMMTAPYNPQANKLMRELLMASRSTVDLSNQDEDNDDHRFYWLAVGQALGVKIHKMPVADAIAKAKALVNADGGVKEAIDILEDWLRKDIGTDRSFKPETIEKLREILGKGEPVPPIVLHTALDLARYRIAEENGELGAYETMMRIEADGITDGLINAMVNFSAGLFTPKWVQTVRKGGLIFSNTPTSMNDNADRVDVYELLSGGLREKMVEELSDLMMNAVTPKNRWRLENRKHVLTLAKYLLPGLQYNRETGELTIERGLVKNPTTVTIYGGGAAGIADKMVDAMKDTLQAMLSDFLEDNTRKFPEEMVNAMKALKVMPSGKIELMTFSGEQEFRLKQAVLYGISKPLVSTINSQVESSTGPRTLIIQADQVATALVEAAYRKMIQDTLAKHKATAKETGWKEGDYITVAEEKAIWEKIRALFPGISTDNQNIWNIEEAVPVSPEESKKAGSDGKPVRARAAAVARSFDDKMELRPVRRVPVQSGVAMAPQIVISTGDGNMVQKAAVALNWLKKILYVYDGIEIPLDQAGVASEEINKAVRDGWLENPMAAVARAFEDIVRVANLEDLDQDALNALVGVFQQGDESEGGESSKAFIKSRIEDLLSQLNDAAKNIGLRKSVLSKVNFSVDHMAGAASPFVNAGESVIPGSEVVNPLDDVGIADALNERYIAEWEAAAANNAENNIPDDTLAMRIEKALGNAGKYNKKSKTRVLALADLKAFLTSKTLTGLSERQRGLVNLMLRSTGNITVVIGKPNALIKEAIKRGAPLEQGDLGNKRGFFHPQSGTLFLSAEGFTAETLLHELIHAATAGKVAAYFTDRKSLSRQDVKAVERIIGLMNDWWSASDIADALSRETQQTLVDARVLTTSLWMGGQQLEAVSEFMSWVLANPVLAQVAASTKVKDKMLLLGRRLVAAIKSLVFGESEAAPKDPGKDIFSNLAFNTALLAATGQKSPSSISADVILFQNNSPGDDTARLNLLRSSIQRVVATSIDKLSDYIDTGNDNWDTTRVTEALGAQRRAQVTANALAANIASRFATEFPMTPEQDSTFRMIVQALATGVQFDPGAMVRIQELFDYAASKLDESSFLQRPDVDDQSDREQSQRKFRTILGRTINARDEDGRSTLLSGFLALAMVNPEFRAVLEKIPAPDVRDEIEAQAWAGQARTLDDRLSNAGIRMMDSLTRWIAGERGGRKGDLRLALDEMVARIAETGEQDKHLIDHLRGLEDNVAEKTLSNANDMLASKMKKAAKAVKAKTVAINNSADTSTVAGKVKSGVAGGVGMFASFFNEDDAESLAAGISTMLRQNGVWQPIQDVLGELVGRTKANGTIFDMIKTVRGLIQRTRQESRTTVPDIIRKKFSRELTADEWSRLFKGLGRTDAGGLLSGMTMTEVLGLLASPADTKKKLAQTIREFNALGIGATQQSIDRGREYAEYMVTGLATEGMLTNATTIFSLGGRRTGYSNLDPAVVKKGEDLVDRMVSLMALELAQADNELALTLAELVNTEKDGVKYALSYLARQAKDERQKAMDNPMSRLNYFKGYIPLTPSEGRTLIVRDMSERARLEMLGYTFVRDYVPDGVSGSLGNRSLGYFYSPSSSRAAFSQGILQTVHQSAGGVDPATGLRSGGVRVGVNYGRNQVQTMTRNIRNNRARGIKNTGQVVRPLFHESGAIVGYEYMVDPREEARLEYDTDLAKILGQWRGRQVEEELAKTYNGQLLERLVDLWNDASVGANASAEKRAGFVNLFDQGLRNRDPVIDDALNLIPNWMMEEIQNNFPDGEFWVPADMVNNIIGYRKASLGDFWTGNTRYSEDTQRAVRNLVAGVMGRDAFSKITKYEEIFQNFVADARLVIAVKSMVVPAANLASGIFQLMAQGAPMAFIARRMPQKISEVNAYIKGRIRQVELEADLRAAADDPIKSRKLKVQLQAIEDNFRRLSIWPLIEAGEFSSISDVGITFEEAALAEGRVGAYIEALTKRLPEGVKTAGRYALIAQDTALFKGLERTVQYGDFICKAVQTDYLHEKRGIPLVEARARASQNFIDYNYLPGRTRSALEANGLLWFYAFKLRSMKVAVSMIRDNPLHALLLSLMPIPDLLPGVGTPLTENILSQELSGKLDFSIGPMMGIHAHTMNPWVNIAS